MAISTIIKNYEPTTVVVQGTKALTFSNEINKIALTQSEIEGILGFTLTSMNNVSVYIQCGDWNALQLKIAGSMIQGTNIVLMLESAVTGTGRINYIIAARKS